MYLARIVANFAETESGYYLFAWVSTFGEERNKAHDDDVNVTRIMGFAGCRKLPEKMHTSSWYGEDARESFCDREARCKHVCFLLHAPTQDFVLIDPLGKNRDLYAL